MKPFDTIKDRLFYGWIVIADLLIIVSIIFGIRFCYGVFFKSIAAEFQLSRLATSAIFSTYMVIGCIFAILGGWALDRYGPRVVLTLMGLFTGFSLVITSLTNAVWQLFFSYSLLLAIGTGASFAVMAATASRWFIKKRGLALGIASSGEGLGIAVTAPLAATFITGFGWRVAFIILGLIAILVVCSLSQLLRKDPDAMGLYPDGSERPSVETDQRKQDHETPEGLSLLNAFKTSTFWHIIAIYFLFSFSFLMVTTHIVPHATDLGMTGPRAALILTLIGVTNTLGRLVMGGVSDRIGRKLSAGICAMLQFAALIFLAWSNEPWMFFLFAIGYGFGFGGLSTSVTAIIGDVFGSGNLGAITGALVVGFALGAAVGPLVGGYIFDLSNDYFFAFLIGAAVVLTATIFVAMIKKEGE